MHFHGDLWPRLVMALVLVGAVVLCRFLSSRPAVTEGEKVATGCCMLPVLVFLAWWWPFVPVDQPRLIAAAEIPGEFRCLATQSFNGDTEPYTIAFYHQYLGRPWQWHYVDHEDIHWSWGAMRINPQHTRAELYHGRRLVAWFEIRTGRFYLAGDPDPRTGDPIAHDPLPSLSSVFPDWPAR